MIDDLDAELRPVVEAEGLELFDVVLRSGVLVVTVDRAGGVDLDALTAANRAVSAALDRLDPVPGRYTLEVTSPGVERPLRTPEHFARAVDEQVTVKTRPQVPGERRLTGVLLSASEDGIELAPEKGAVITLAYSDIDRARTVFTWGPQRPNKGAKGAKAGAATAKAAKVVKGDKGGTGEDGGHGGADVAVEGGSGGVAPATKAASVPTPSDEHHEHDARERKQVATS